ncbi:hypothetical protein [Kitasatospora sp. NPDC001547]|uniref:hypothetical protein n=1 Tax=Kitasatospora sp. NPDC001547 TaxID=3364015 RepID=UPI0036B5580D
MGIMGSTCHSMKDFREERRAVAHRQLSADQSLLFTANRGLNTITVYDYPANTVRLRVAMPELRSHLPELPVWTDPRLGFHHSTLLSPQAAPARNPA